MNRTLRIMFVLALFFGVTGAAVANDIPLMTAEELKTKLNDDNVVILDVRGSWDWVKTGDKIAGAIREDPDAPEQWAGNYPKGKTIVLYCA